MQAKYQTVKRSNKKQCQTTIPSQKDQSIRSKCRQNQKRNQQNFSKVDNNVEEQQSQKSEQKEQLTQKIYFRNGWSYHGSHINQKFHGWGELIDNFNYVIYKGNFSNGYFHNYGQILNNEYFSYLIDEKSVKILLNKRMISENSLSIPSNSNQKQHLVNKNIKRIDQQQNAIYSFAKSKHQKTFSLIQDNTKSKSKDINLKYSHSKKQLNIKWIQYQGEFFEGNIEGFGTLVIHLLKKQQNLKANTEIQKIIIIGKFQQGKILNGILQR